MAEDVTAGRPGPFKFLILAILLGWYLLLLPLIWLDVRNWRHRRANASDNLQESNLVGRRAVLTDVNDVGVGSLLLDDAWWVANFPEDVAVEDGTEVEVVRVTGATLTVRPA